MAKVIDTFSRVHGLLVSTALIIIGLLIQAAARNIAVAGAAQILYGTGWNSLGYILTVLIADMTSLKNRALAYRINVTPVIDSSFAAPKVAEILNDRLDWRWTFGASAFIVLASCLPITITIFWAGRAFRLAHVAESCAATTANRHRFETLRRFFIELDVPGVILVMVGFCLTLLPITIANIVDNAYRNTGIIVMLAAGFVSMIGFVAREKWLAPVTYMPWALMRDGNLIGGCLVALASVGSASFWYLHYGSYL